jgi:hypothetical protein
VEEQSDPPTALPLPFQLKLWNWGQKKGSGPRKYFHATQILVTHLPYNGPYKASVHSHLPHSWIPSDDFILQRISSHQPPQPTSVLPRHISFYDSHSTAPKNGETPSPSTFVGAGTYFHYPSPDTDVPSRSSDYFLPSIEVSRSLSLYATDTAIHTRSTLSPSPIVTRSSPTFINNIHRYSPRISRRFITQDSTTTSTRGSARRGGSYYRRATAHGGRGKPHFERQRKYYQTGLPSTFTQRHPQVQATLKTVGIDDETILRRDRKIRVSCCR